MPEMATSPATAPAIASLPMGRGLRSKRVMVPLALAAASLAIPGVATGQVLVNTPISRGCFGHSIDVGVWWKQTTPVRAYQIQIFDPSGRLVFSRTGNAPSDNWRLWHYIPRAPGLFRSVYVTGSSPDVKLSTRIAATGCFSGNV